MSLQGFERIEIPEIQMVRHHTVESIFHRFWSFGEDVLLEDILASSAGGFSEDGEEFEMPMTEQLEATRANEFWAFSDCPRKEIHVWTSREFTDQELNILIGHEVGHILEAEEITENAPEYAEELQADRYGVCCAIVPELIEKYKTSPTEQRTTT